MKEFKEFKVISYEIGGWGILKKRPVQVVWAAFGRGIPPSYGDLDPDDDGYRRITPEYPSEEEALKSLAAYINDCLAASAMAEDFG